MKRRYGIYADFSYLEKSNSKIIPLDSPAIEEKLNLLLHCGYKLEESDGVFHLPDEENYCASLNVISVEKVLAYNLTELSRILYKASVWDGEYGEILKENSFVTSLMPTWCVKLLVERKLNKRILKMDREGLKYFGARYFDKHETTALEITNVLNKIPEETTKEFNQYILFKIYLELKDLALRFPRLCFRTEQLNELTQQSLRDYSHREMFPVLQLLFLDSIFASESFEDATVGLLGDSMEYPHFTQRLSEKGFVDKLIMECEHGFAVFADSIEIVKSGNKTFIKVIQTGSNMPRSESHYTKTMYFDATRRSDTEKIIALAKASIRIDK